MHLSILQICLILYSCLFVWMDYAFFFRYRVISRGEVYFMMNTDIFQLFFNYLEERSYNNIHQNVKQDADYLKSAIQENKLHEQYKKAWLIGWAEKNHNVVDRFHPVTESTYTAVVFRMGMQFCFSLLMQLADL